MKAEEPTLLADWVLAIMRVIQSYGQDPLPLLDKTGIKFELLDQHGSRVSVAKTNHLWKLAVQETGDPLIGLRMPEYNTSTTLYALDVAVMASATPREILETLSDFSLVASTSLKLEVVENDDQLSFVFRPLYSVSPCFESMDAFLAVIFVAAERLEDYIGGFFKSMSLRRSCPLEKEVYEKQFGVPISYNCPMDAIELDSSLMDVALPTANPDIKKFFKSVLSKYKEKLSCSELELKVRSAIKNLLGKELLSKKHVADVLNISSRQLGRQLADEGLSYRLILDDVRQKMAVDLIKNSSMPISEIGLQVGFVEPSNFSRAFRRWTGFTPAEYRDSV